MSKATEILAKLIDSGVMPDEEGLADLVQDLVSAEMSVPRAVMGVDPTVGGVLSPMPDIGERDGVLLLLFTPDRRVLPHILRLGVMSEGMLEGSIMSIYQSIVQERVRLANAARLRERTVSHVA